MARMPGKLQLVLDADGEHFRRPAVEEKLRQALSATLTEDIKLEFVSQSGQTTVDTPAKREQAAVANRLKAAAQSIENDPNVRQMMDVFGAVVQSESIKPIDSSS